MNISPQLNKNQYIMADQTKNKHDAAYLDIHGDMDTLELDDDDFYLQDAILPDDENLVLTLTVTDEPNSPRAKQLLDTDDLLLKLINEPPPRPTIPNYEPDWLKETRPNSPETQRQKPNTDITSTQDTLPTDNDHTKNNLSLSITQPTKQLGEHTDEIDTTHDAHDLKNNNSEKTSPSPTDNTTYTPEHSHWIH